MSARVGIFALRHQRGGVILDRLFSAPPSAEVLAAEQTRLDGLHGPGWLRPIPLALELAPEHAALAERLAPAPRIEQPAAPGLRARLPGLVFHAVVDVTPPRPADR